MEITPQQLAFIAFLTSIGFFEIRSGSIQLTVNFDALGAIGSVETQTKHHYRMEKLSTPRP